MSHNHETFPIFLHVVASIETWSLSKLLQKVSVCANFYLFICPREYESVIAKQDLNVHMSEAIRIARTFLWTSYINYTVDGESQI